MDVPGDTFADEITVLERRWNDFDFFFVHFKATDAAGEDGDFERKARLFEEVDREIPRIRALKPEVFVVTSDHSTPARFKAHSWHPAPFALASPNALPDLVESYSERRLVTGGFGRFPGPRRHAAHDGACAEAGEVRGVAKSCASAAAPALRRIRTLLRKTQKRKGICFCAKPQKREEEERKKSRGFAAESCAAGASHPCSRIMRFAKTQEAKSRGFAAE